MILLTLPKDPTIFSILVWYKYVFTCTCHLQKYVRNIIRIFTLDSFEPCIIESYRCYKTWSIAWKVVSKLGKNSSVIIIRVGGTIKDNVGFVNCDDILYRALSSGNVAMAMLLLPNVTLCKRYCLQYRDFILEKIFNYDLFKYSFRLTKLNTMSYKVLLGAFEVSFIFFFPPILV